MALCLTFVYLCRFAEDGLFLWILLELMEMQAVWVDVLSVRAIISCQVSEPAQQSVWLCVCAELMQNVQCVGPEYTA